MLRQISKLWVLSLMRLGAALVLVFLYCCFYCGIELRANAFTAAIPLVYILGKAPYLMPKLTIFVIPILTNIALWLPYYPSYWFIRAVLYVEFIKLLANLVVLLLALTIFKAPKGLFIYGMLAVIVVLLCIYRFILNSLKSEKYRNCFHVGSFSEQEMKWPMRTMVLIFCLFVISLVVTDNYLQVRFPPRYAQVETMYFILEPLKTVQGGKPAIYKHQADSSMGTILRMSTDQKMFLARILYPGNQGKDLFIFDTKKLINSHVLQTPLVPRAQGRSYVYTFANDNQHIIVGDETYTGAKIKFQVVNIATGRLDKRFSDPLRLLDKVVDNSAVRSIKFNDNGKYFVVLSNAIEVWDYQRGILVFIDQQLAGRIGSFAWVSENAFVASDKNMFYYYELVDNNGSIQVSIKEKINLAYGKEKSSSESIKSGDTKKYFIMNSFSYNLLFRQNKISIWDVASEQRVLSVYSTNRVRDVQLFDNKERLLVFEELRDKSGKLSVWNISSGKKEREVLVPPIEWSGSMHVMDAGKKVVVVGEAAYFISL